MKRELVKHEQLTYLASKLNQRWPNKIVVVPFSLSSQNVQVPVQKHTVTSTLVGDVTEAPPIIDLQVQWIDREKSKATEFLSLSRVTNCRRNKYIHYWARDTYRLLHICVDSQPRLSILQCIHAYRSILHCRPKGYSFS